MMAGCKHAKYRKGTINHGRQETSPLPDEALDAVTGGAGYRFNEETGEYDVYTRSGTKVGSFDWKKDAQDAALDLSIRGL